MARVLEAVGNAARSGVALRSLRVLPDGAHWSVNVDAFAAGSDQSASSQAADRFRRALSESPVFNDPLGPPVIRNAPKSGSEISAGYRVRR